MKIKEIYNKYGIPEILQLHMLRVAACSKLILDHWKGTMIQKDSILRISLLHDMGNIVKIQKEEYPDNINFLENRKKYIELCGKDDHKISEMIARQQGLTEEEIIIMNQKIFMKNDETITSNSYERKITAYCDQRVEPDGVYDIVERLTKAKERYKDKPGTSMNNPKTDELIKCAKILEQQIMKYCDIVPNEINNQAIEKIVEELKEYEIEKKN